MRTLEQIAAAAKRKGVMFQIEEKTTPWEPYGCGMYDICLASKFDGHCSSSWFVFDPENKDYPLVHELYHYVERFSWDDWDYWHYPEDWE